MRSSFLSRSALAAAVVTAVPAWAGTTGSSAVLTGPLDARYFNANASVGSINGDTTYGGLNPFNPPFDPSQIVAVDPGDTLTVQLSAPVSTFGANLGVYSSVGFVDQDTTNGTGVATGTVGSGIPPQIFDQDANGSNVYFQSVVSVSQDGVNWVALNGGHPIAFTNPTNAFLDQPISNDYQNLGSVPSNMSKPFLGSIGSFSGENYGQIKTTLDGSAGGTWLNLSGIGLTSVNDVRFSVPAGANYQGIIDAVAGADIAAPIVLGQPIISESVGTGTNTSYVVVDFGQQSYDFQVHYNGSISGIDALNLIESGSYLTYGSTYYGPNLGYLVTNFDYGGYDQTNAGSSYWHYFTSADGGNSYGLSNVGASSRMLTNGSYDGWDFSAVKTAPVTPLATVPEPASLALVAVGAGALRRRRR